MYNDAMSDVYEMLVKSASPALRNMARSAIRMFEKDPKAFQNMMLKGNADMLPTLYSNGFNRDLHSRHIHNILSSNLPKHEFDKALKNNPGGSVHDFGGYVYDHDALKAYNNLKLLSEGKVYVPKDQRAAFEKRLAEIVTGRKANSDFSPADPKKMLSKTQADNLYNKFTSTHPNPDPNNPVAVAARNNGYVLESDVPLDEQILAGFHDGPVTSRTIPPLYGSRRGSLRAMNISESEIPSNFWLMPKVKNPSEGASWIGNIREAAKYPELAKHYVAPGFGGETVVPNFMRKFQKFVRTKHPIPGYESINATDLPTHHNQRKLWQGVYEDTPEYMLKHPDDFSWWATHPANAIQYNTGTSDTLPWLTKVTPRIEKLIDWDKGVMQPARKYLDSKTY